jgi:hypothetical protein
MSSHTIIRMPETDRARSAFCPACEGEKRTISYRNSQGRWYCRCLDCACRFWAA